jgi:hypothetical protein
MFLDYIDEAFEQFVYNVPSQIWTSGQYAYRKVANISSKTLAQEFWIPGEIISIIAEQNPKHEIVKQNIQILSKLL